MSPASSAKKKTKAEKQSGDAKASKTAKTAEATKSSEPKGCTHHWVIEPPNGAVSKGRCKACGEEKEFRNSFEYSSWYGNKSPGAKGAAAAKGGAKAAAPEASSGDAGSKS